MTNFSADARRAIEWTVDQLSAEAQHLLAGLPQGPREVASAVICHGAPFDEDFYMFRSADARRAEAVIRAPLCLFGHTHVAAGWTQGRPVEIGHDSTLPIPTAGTLLVNVGSVGQPRDGDPRAAYGILDTARRVVECYRVEYDIELAQRRIREVGLPEGLAARLALGR
jgi:diadenosine tetraphosphatase ApaH/serine/threonine PP2A family protein phosphatase